MGSNGQKVSFSTRIDLPQEVRDRVIATLNQSLAETTDLKSQVKQAHWNVKGLDFYQLHELFDEMASELEEFIDMIAERVTALGGLALGTIRIAASNSTLPEYPTDIFVGKDHITALADRYGIYAKAVRDAIDVADDLGDADTADLFTEVSREIDKRLWFLEAHLYPETATVALSNGAKPEESAAPAKAKKSAAKRK